MYAKKYYEAHSNKAVDHTLFDDLHELVVELGAVFLSNPVNTYSFLNEMKGSKIGCLNNFVYAIFENEKMLLTTDLSFDEKGVVVDRIISDLKSLYTDSISVDAQADLFSLKLCENIAEYAKTNIRLSHLYIFNNKYFQDALSDSNELQSIYNKIIDIRDNIYKNSFHLILKSISLYEQKNAITRNTLLNIENDIVNESLEYLTSAIFRFNPQMDLQFSTSASRWITRGIQEVVCLSRNLTYGQFTSKGPKIQVVNFGIGLQETAIDENDGYDNAASINKLVNSISGDQVVEAYDAIEVSSCFVHALATKGYDRNTSETIFNFYNGDIDAQHMYEKTGLDAESIECILNECKKEIIEALSE